MQQDAFDDLAKVFRRAHEQYESTGFHIEAFAVDPRNRGPLPEEFACHELFGVICLPGCDFPSHSAYVFCAAKTGCLKAPCDRFNELSSKAGELLPDSVRDALYWCLPTEPMLRWMAFLWWAEVNQQFISSASMGGFGMPPRWDLVLPFKRSVDAIVQCRLNTNAPVFPQAVPDEPERWLTVTEAAKISFANKGIISRAADEGYIATNGMRGGARRIDAISLARWVLKRPEEPGPSSNHEEVIRKAREAQNVKLPNLR